ncbi:uncharacterized protein LOC116125059 [Pistacia vera]|uniref:uncharacterized protein LOC116125059 n=1 Tax=Pistacia vera TaxID=55513 RepID=UPI0012630D6C|nr:uncharacterized protein LOC116125059 [Pistacia vera]
MANVVKFDRDYHVPDPYRRGKIGWFLTNFTKFTVDSAVNVSFKGVVGGRKLYKILQEGFKNQPPPCSLNERTNLHDIESVEEMQAKMEEMQEDMNIVKQQNKASAKLSEPPKPQKKIPNEDIKGSDLLRTKEKRVFIRSRL